MYLETGWVGVAGRFLLLTFLFQKLEDSLTFRLVRDRLEQVLVMIDVLASNEPLHGSLESPSLWDAPT
jgi:hypothetical protein